MRARWKILSATCIASVWAATILVGQIGEVSGDTTDTTTTAATPPPTADPELRDPFTPYPLGPGTITYEQLGAADRAAVDQIQETTETSQPPTSHQAFARATAQASDQAEQQIAARNVGLVGTEQDGVVP